MSEPYYTDDLVTLWHGDCRNLTEWTAAEVLVTDPPYGINGHLSSGYRGKRPPGGHVRVHERPMWDTGLDIRNRVLAMWGDKPYAVFGSPARIDDAPPHREIPLVWNKAVIGMGDTTFPWGRSYELIYISGTGWSGPRDSSVLSVTHASNHARQDGHPTAKPISLLEAVIRKAPPGIIADPFAGTGSTLIAARNLGRRAIGIEIDERYCEIAANRLSQDVLDLEAAP